MTHKSISPSATDPELLEEIGARLRALRQARGLRVEDAARESGLNKSTVSRAEHGDNPTLLTVLRLLRTYGRLGGIESFIPEPGMSPMELIRGERGKRG
jgi:putative transcriptional regulator